MSPSPSPTVLIADDDADCRALLRDLIGQLRPDWIVREVRTGPRVLDYLHRRGRFAAAPKPILICLDMEMPGLTGLDALRVIRKEEGLKDIPVMMATSLRDEAIELAATEAGADVFAVKPVSAEAVREAIDRAWRTVDAEEAAGSGTPPSECPRVLLIEDDADQRDLIGEALRLHYGDAGEDRIVTVGSAAEALDTDLARFDVILEDYNLPDMPGLELLEKMLAEADVPIIFVTGQNDSATAAEAIRRGAQDYLVKLGDYLFALPVLIDKGIRQHRMKTENERLQQELQTMLSELRIKNVQLRESLERLEVMATTDHLTGAANRRRFGELLQRYYAEAARYDFDLTCCMLDLDGYKQINDALGHMVGDELLILAADVIRSSLRSSDIVARYGGDEFVLLLPHTTEDRGAAVCERIRQELAARSREHSHLRRPVTLSIGVASLKKDRPTSADALVAMSDKALYAAKETGKDRLVAFRQVADRESVPA